MGKVTIPKYVAKHIEKWKEEDLTLFMALDFCNASEEKETMKWLFGNEKDVNEHHAYLLARAWVEGYEVEEKLYNVIMPSRTKVYKYHALGIDGVLTKTNELGERYQLTEKEIKAIDPRFMAFAEEVK